MGLPGAKMAGVVEESALTGVGQVYIVQEPDAAGVTCVKAIANRLQKWRWEGKAAVVHLSNAKDPNELYKQDRKGFRAAFQHALDHAEPLLFHHAHPVDLPAGVKPNIFSLKELLSWELPPTRWAIPEILPEGLTLLAGKPKLGKAGGLVSVKVAWPRSRTISRSIRACGWSSSIPGPGLRHHQESAAVRSAREIIQQLTLSFDTITAMWSVIGNTDEVGRTKARQQIIDLLHEQPEGMSQREIAEALEKNYHTTRSLLRKMEEIGEVGRLDGRYLAFSGEKSHGHMQQPSLRNGQIKQSEYHQTIGHATPGGDRGDDHDGAALNDGTDYGDYTDYIDYGNDTPADSFTKERTLDEATALQKGMKSITLLQGDRHQQEPAVISVINRNQLHVSEPSLDVQDILPCEVDQTARTEQRDASPQRDHCPHHPRARMVRFDPAGQAWCDRMDCWDCYRLMKIGEVLGYRCLEEQEGKLLIEQGMEAWVAYVLIERAFLVTWATQEALALCRVLGIEEPELSGEVKRLVEVPEVPP